MNKVLIIVGDATETVDTLYPYYRLIEGGYEPVVAAPEKRLYQMVLHEVKPGWTITKEWEGYTIQADIAFKDINEEEYVGIFFSGGRAPEYIRDDEDLIRITQHFFEKNKPIASVCHGVEIPAARVVLKDVVWRPCQNASSIWKFVVGSSSMHRASLTGIWSAAVPITIMVNISAPG